MKKLLITISIFFSVLTGFAQQTIPLNNWKFQTGDNLKWAQPGFDDLAWKPMKVGELWENLGYADYDGYAWYRVKFFLPSSLKQGQANGAVSFALGQIDDCDQTWLNGKLLGQNTEHIPAGNAEVLKDMSTLTGMYTVKRNYIISFSDPRLKWDAENTLAIRVYDIGGGGGMITTPLTVGLGKLSDYVIFDYRMQLPQALPDGTISKTVTLKNLIAALPTRGKLNIRVIDALTRKTVAKETRDLLAEEKEQTLTFSFKGSLTSRLLATYTFTPNDGSPGFSYTEEFPYILTPASGSTPRINGAKVTGVRPRSPFLFRVPVTGQAPLTVSAEGLPEGLVFDSEKRTITGRVRNAGTYRVKLHASNARGTVSGELKIVAGDRIALTPPMGWNSWNCFGLTVTEDKMKAAADRFLSSGLADHGWTYINLDDGWEAPQRDTSGNIVPNGKFSDMKGLTGYIHDYGLKAGIYSSPGPKTCGNFLGSYEHELSDAQTYANWGFDYLKYDWCSYESIAKDHSLPELQKPYQVMNEALQQTGRDMVYSLCQYGKGDVWQWGDSVGGNAWRTTSDIIDTWESMGSIGFNQQAGSPYARPGNWNDPDMLVVGWVGWGVLHPTRLTPSEQYTHISLWAMLAAPLLIGCDLEKLDDFTLNLLTNDEVIAIDQDPLGKQGVAVIKDPAYQVMVKDLEDGSKAVALFNLSETDLKITAPWNKLGITGNQKVRDLWRQKDLGVFSGKFESTVPGHGVVMVKISK